jgi:hypothetical protein
MRIYAMFVPAAFLPPFSRRSVLAGENAGKDGCRDKYCDYLPPPQCGKSRCVKKMANKEYQAEVPV